MGFDTELVLDKDKNERVKAIDYVLDSKSMPGLDFFKTEHGLDVRHDAERGLKDAGVAPEEVITDAPALYPQILAEVWPTAAHQLCLFHEARRLTGA